jgi:hypothetical protein
VVSISYEFTQEINGKRKIRISLIFLKKREIFLLTTIFQNYFSLTLTTIHFIKKSITFAGPKAHVVKLADTSDLGSDAVRCVGSSPSMRTFFNRFLIKRKKPTVSGTV